MNLPVSMTARKDQPRSDFDLAVKMKGITLFGYAALKKLTTPAPTPVASATM